MLSNIETYHPITSVLEILNIVLLISLSFRMCIDPMDAFLSIFINIFGSGLGYEIDSKPTLKVQPEL